MGCALKGIKSWNFFLASFSLRLINESVLRDVVVVGYMLRIENEQDVDL